jgi:hypothetical protein
VLSALRLANDHGATRGDVPRVRPVRSGLTEQERSATSMRAACWSCSGVTVIVSRPYAWG